MPEINTCPRAHIDLAAAVTDMRAIDHDQLRHDNLQGALSSFLSKETNFDVGQPTFQHFAVKREPPAKSLLFFPKKSSVKKENESIWHSKSGALSATSREGLDSSSFDITLILTIRFLAVLIPFLLTLGVPFSLRLQ